MTTGQRLLKALASLKLAVIVILALGTITAWGTFVEADFDATTAQKVVYHSWWMYSVLILLIVNLTAVMVDRWPWQKRHRAFVLAHIGIIILLFGSWVTKKYGIDGSMRFGIGETAKHVITAETDLAVYTSLDGSSYRKIYDREVDFFSNPPTEKKPVVIEIPSGEIKITEYMPFAFRDQKIVEVKDSAEGIKQAAGAAVRFQLQNPRVNVTEWLLQPGTGRDAVKDLGPAQVVLTTEKFVNEGGRNAVVLRPRKVDGKLVDELEYEIHTAKNAKNVRKGVIKPGDTIETGWMGLVLRVLKYMPQAREEISFKKSERPTPLTMAAIKVIYDGKPQWVALNSLLKLFSDQAVYVLAYANRRLELDFQMNLKDFRVGRYQGTMRAASYESLVQVPGSGDTLISMNEPLKHNGFTFYQASFEEDEQGRPVASVLSVNRDPGRWIKYLGSLLIVLGSAYLFYDKRKAARAAAAKGLEARP